MLRRASQQRELSKHVILLDAKGRYDDAQGASLRIAPQWFGMGKTKICSCRTVPPELQRLSLAQTDLDLRAALERLIASPIPDR